MNDSAVDKQGAIEDFVDEALDSLLGLGERLDGFRLSPEDAEPINAVFRAIHSMKGCAAFLDLDAIKVFAHSLENTLDDVRNGSVALHEDLQRAIVDGFDVLESLLHEAARGSIVKSLDSQSEGLLERIKSLSRASACERTSEEELVEYLTDMAAVMSRHETEEVKEWGRRLGCLVHDYLGANGKMESDRSGGAVEAESPALEPGDFVEARCFCDDADVSKHVAGLIELFDAHASGRYDKAAGKNFIDSANAFADWAEQQGKTALAESLSAAVADFQMIFDSPLDFDDHLISVIWDQLRPALKNLRRESGLQGRQTGNNEKKVDPQKAKDAANKASVPPDDGGREKPAEKALPAAAKGRFVRVREERLDEFLEHVSRLFITSELFKDVHARMADSGQLAALVDELRQINNGLKVESAALQRGVVSLRRVAVAGLFSKFPRMARTLAAKLGKKISVRISGEDTEIDKTLAEDLEAPLMHLIRNVVDHGIETPEERRRRGGDETGTLWLAAEETKNRVRITVRDDGRGIDPARLRAKAVEKGVVSQAEAEAMSDEETLQLIFRPGFSTAEKVSDVSGRGVGMDVVRTTLAGYNGEVFVESTLGAGTTLRLEIPIRQTTLVIDGLMVAEGGQEYVVPFEFVKEINAIGTEDFCTAHGRPLVTLRQGTYDAITLSEIFGMQKTRSEDSRSKEKRAAALLSSRQGAFCLLVDRIVGHRQVVVTGLKEIINGAEKTAGVAQLGGGRLALVLNVPEIIKSLTSTPFSISSASVRR